MGKEPYDEQVNASCVPRMHLSTTHELEVFTWLATNNPDGPRLSETALLGMSGKVHMTAVPSGCQHSGVTRAFATAVTYTPGFDRNSMPSSESDAFVVVVCALPASAVSTRPNVRFCEVEYVVASLMPSLPSGPSAITAVSKAPLNPLTDTEPDET